LNPSEIRIETERLLLRPPRIEDFDAFAELQGDAGAARFIGGQVTRARPANSGARDARRANA